MRCVVRVHRLLQPAAVTDFIVDVEPSVRWIADSDIVSQNHHDQAAALGDDERSVALTRTLARRWAT
jgi:hypothetical protein